MVRPYERQTTMHTYAQTNLQTCDYRTTHRPQAQTQAERVAWLRDYLATNAHMAWTDGYKARQAELSRFVAEQGRA